MGEKHELIQSFYLPAPGVTNEMAVKVMDPAPDDSTHLELVVLNGGPVFLFDGRINGAEAYRRTRGVKTTDFAIGSNGNSKSVMGVHARYGTFTVAADVESIGYVRAYKQE